MGDLPPHAAAPGSAAVAATAMDESFMMVVARRLGLVVYLQETVSRAGSEGEITTCTKRRGRPGSQSVSRAGLKCRRRRGVESEARRDQGCRRNGAGESYAPVPTAAPHVSARCPAMGQTAVFGGQPWLSRAPSGQAGLPAIC